MAKKKVEGSEPGAWMLRDVPRNLMQRAKIGAAVEGRTVKDMILSLVDAHLAEMEKKGQLPKSRS